MRKSILGFLLFTAFLCRAETIKDKVLEFLPLEHDLVVISAEGDRSSDAKFTRNSNALDNKFNIVGRNLPRFAPQGGLVIENGGRSDERGAVNFLSPELADFASAGIKELDAGKAKLESVPGLQGQAISFSGTLLLKNIPLRLNKSHVFSYYAKGEGVLAVSLCVTNKSGKTTDIPVATRQLSGEWQRFYHSFKEDKDPVESLQVTFTADNAVIDSLMLEGPCIYFQRTSPSSFVSGGEWRAAELLKLPMPEELRSGETGAFSFNFTPTASGGWQDLFAIGGWWKPELDLSWYSARLQFSFRDKVVNANAAIEIGKTYHLLIQYGKNEAELFLDGKKIASIIATSKAFVSRQILLGGRIIEIKSDGIFRNFAVYRAPLGQDEIASLASMPDLSGILPRKQLSLCSKYHVFPVNIGKVRINWKTDAKLESVTASVSGFKTGKTFIEGNNVFYEFDPAFLMPGKYQIVLDCNFADKSSETTRSPMEIVPALRPWNNFQVSAWNEYNADFASLGFTIVRGELVDPQEFDEIARQQLYANCNLHYFGIPRPDAPEDRAVDYAGNPSYVNIRSPYVRQNVIEYASQLAAQLADAPIFKAVVINTESSAGGVQFNLSDREIQYAKDKFKLDLTKWKGFSADKYRWYFQPLGWLSTRPAPELVPASGIIPSDNPIYAYLLDRHGPDGGTEVVINDLIAKELLKQRPDILAMQDPILRRPALRSYKNINVAQDWFYYTDLWEIVKGAEALMSLSRGNPGMSISVMPQFLFKPGMAAPYGGMPPVDMFREASYLAASRPGRVISFWNAGHAITKGKQQSPDEIKEILGGLDYAEAAKAIKEKKLELFLWDPRMKDEIKNVSDHLWLPFGALLPRWQNAPRRIAIIDSFASHIFGNNSWRFTNYLYNSVGKSGIPYDLLLDNDLQSDIPDYDVIILPSCDALPEKAVQNLNEYVRRGGMLVVDDKFCVQGLDGATKIFAKEVKKDTLSTETELLKKYGYQSNHPQYIEAMEQLVREDTNNCPPELDKLLKSRPKTAFSTDGRNIYWNHLQAAGGDYLFVVNDLRVPGELYGRYGRVREQGVAQKLSFRLNNPKMRHAYDLTEQKELPISPERTVSFELPPAAGRIILFTELPVGKLELSFPAEVKRGVICAAEICLGDADGLVPVNLELFLPDGERSSISHYDVIEAGTLRWDIPIPLNAPVGKWRLKASEFASGQSKEQFFTVK